MTMSKKNRQSSDIERILGVLKTFLNAQAFTGRTKKLYKTYYLHSQYEY